MNKTWLPADPRQRIQDLIKSSHLTQADLAGIIGLSESAFSRYLQGKTEMLGDGYIIKIARYFDVSTDFLLGETDIPDRKNYDIEELGLSAESARLLYTGRIDSHILNLLLENPRFPQLIALLSRYQNEIVKTGIAAMNQYLSFLNSMLLEQAEKTPESASSAMQTAFDIKAIRTPVINADTTAIQNLFMQIVRDIKAQGEAAAATDHQAASAKVLKHFRQELSKGQDSPDLRKLTVEDVTAAVMKMISVTCVSEESLRDFGTAYKKVLDEMKELTHDQ